MFDIPIPYPRRTMYDFVAVGNEARVLFANSFQYAGALAAWIQLCPLGARQQLPRDSFKSSTQKQYQLNCRELPLILEGAFDLRRA